MSQETPKQYEPTPPIQQQISLLNLRINDIMDQNKRRHEGNDGRERFS